MRVGIVGACGYLGRKLRKAIEKEHFVKGFDILESEYKEDVVLDVRDLRACIKHIKNLDIVFHKVGLMGCGRSWDSPKLFYQTNVSGSLNVLKACERNKIKRFVFDSTQSVFGTNNASPLCENDLPEPDSVYGATKLIAEQYITSFCYYQGIDYAIMRYPRVVGPDSKTFINNFIRASLKNETILITDKGGYSFDLVHIDDVIAGNMAILRTHRASGIFHVSGETPLRVYDICNIIEENTGVILKKKKVDVTGQSDGRFLPNPLFLQCDNLKTQTGQSPVYDSGTAVKQVCLKTIAF